MAHKKVKNRNDFNTLYDATMAGAPLTKQALALIGEELKEESQNTEKERRNEKLNDPKIRYVRDRFGLVHDKSCKLVERYPYNDLTWMVDAGVNLSFCKECYRKAIIRRGVGKDIKRINDYVAFFDRHNVSNYDLKNMFMINDIKVRLLGADILWVKEREDEWKIEYDYEQRVYILWHNSYIVRDRKRYMTGDFHKQEIKMNQTFGQVFYNIATYSNKIHMDCDIAQKEQAAVALMEQGKKVAATKRLEGKQKEDNTQKNRFSYFDRFVAQGRA